MMIARCSVRPDAWLFGAMAALCLVGLACVRPAGGTPDTAGPGVPADVREIPSETPEESTERHRRVAERCAGTPILVHRGASALAPENTLEAYAAAMDRGADGAEIDIRRSKDGVLYLLHDDTVDRMLAGSGPAADRTYDELARLPFREAPGVDAKGARVPTLAAVLVLARRRAMLLHLDVKEPGLDDDIIRMLDAADAWDHVVHVNDYHTETLRRDSRLRLLAYKGWFPRAPGNPPEPEADAERCTVSEYLARPGEMIFIAKDPRPAVEAFRRF